ncbi:hypothetical protein SCHPADRAFT_935293 [Schizopora paradoxa]|uniref:MYND-type domain-containing protein n=1 Tax=Schizopora paradoxa TaxID=27342 RepID=A0A0H2S5L8_9AGAM|nr:hypothetical protein SCHPADRAFT_935293 [Schizopora paradoxa]
MTASDTDSTALGSSDSSSSLVDIEAPVGVQSAEEPSLDELCTLLVDSLDDTSHPKHCATYLTRCIQLLEQQKGWRNTTREYNHAFWNKITRFVCSPHSMSEIDALESRLSRCCCDLSDATTKLIHNEREDSTRTGKGKKKKKGSHSSPSFATFMSTIFGILHDCLMKADFIKVCKATGNKPLKFWPTTPFDLLPFDGTRVVDTLMLWISKLQQPVVYATLGRIALNTRSYTRPHLMSPEVGSPFWRGMLSVTSPIRNPNSSIPAKQKRRIVDCFEDCLESVLTFWPTTKIIDNFNRSQCFDLLIMCSNSIAISFPSSNFAKSGFKEGSASNYSLLATSLYEILRFSQRCPPLKSLHIEIQKHHARDFGDTPEQIHFKALYAIYRTRTRNQQCAAPNCRMKAELSPSTTLRHCARCRCMLYCSQTCQVNAWKHPSLPHRDICKSLETVSPYFDGLRDGQVRIIAKKCLEEGIERDTMRLILKHILTLESLKGVPDV